jgi:AraC family transcriptional regulator of adaptative response/methylated-DNA-[protein]-cysteine methyltransferase
MDITYGVHSSPFGQMLLATTAKGICALRFIGEGGSRGALAELTEEWPKASIIENPATTNPTADEIFNQGRKSGKHPFHLALRGTNFQVQVWRALLAIPPGTLVSYQDVAGYIGKPAASRAVAGAIARNPIGYLIPCHRVINKAGRFHHYRWGSARKKAIIGWEAARTKAILPTR